MSEVPQQGQVASISQRTSVDRDMITLHTCPLEAEVLLHEQISTECWPKQLLEGGVREVNVTGHLLSRDMVLQRTRRP